MTILTPTELRTLREEDLNLTQEELAKLLNCNRRTVLRWENGETTPSTATMLHLRPARPRVCSGRPPMVSGLPTSPSSTCSPASVVCVWDSSESRTTEAGASTPASGIVSVGRPTGRTSSRASRSPVTSREVADRRRPAARPASCRVSMPAVLAGRCLEKELPRTASRIRRRDTGHAVFRYRQDPAGITSLKHSSLRT